VEHDSVSELWDYQELNNLDYQEVSTVDYKGQQGYWEAYLFLMEQKVFAAHWGLIAKPVSASHPLLADQRLCIRPNN